jgi:dsDNA-specific endonuclease/ATPase MutS2
MDPIQLPIDGILDLHTFRPQEIKDLIPDYLEECSSRNITRVRIIHGKGTGTLRRLTHAILSRTLIVQSYRLDSEEGNWGVTIVFLKER